MAFGINGGEQLINRSTNNSTQLAQKDGDVGQVTEVTTYAAMEEIQTEEFAEAGSFANEAVNGQSSAADGNGVVTAHNLLEDNKAYQRATKTTVTPLGLTTTTTTA
jgi:hypothetical protein